MALLSQQGTPKSGGEGAAEPGRPSSSPLVTSLSGICFRELQKSLTLEVTRLHHAPFVPPALQNTEPLPCGAQWWPLPGLLLGL